MDFSLAVVIVSHRRPRDLERCLAALAYQNVINFEIIVVSDRPPSVNRFLHTPVKFIEYSDRNISKARNIGIEATKAPIIAFCDDDAVPDPYWLDRLVAPFYEHENLGGATGFVRGRNGISYQWKAVAFNRSGQDIPFTAIDESKTTILPPHPNYFYKCIGTNCAFRRHALHDIGGFDHAFHYYLDDADVSKRLANAGYDVAIVPDAQIIHNYRASRGRGINRVPQSLYDLGASTHHFLRKHNAKFANYHLTKLVDDQTKRLNEFYHYGMLDARQIKGLLRDLRIGIQAGEARKSITPLPKIATMQTIPLERRELKTQIVSGRDIEPNGAEVKIAFRPRITSHSARLNFKRRGNWQLKMGRFGRLERKGRFWRYRSSDALRNEVVEFLTPRFGEIDVE